MNLGILAHVDAGKTTLTESRLYHSESGTNASTESVIGTDTESDISVCHNLTVTDAAGTGFDTGLPGCYNLRYSPAYAEK